MMLIQHLVRINEGGKVKSCAARFCSNCGIGSGLEQGCHHLGVPVEGGLPSEMCEYVFQSVPNATNGNKYKLYGADFSLQ